MKLRVEKSFGERQFSSADCLIGCISDQDIIAAGVQIPGRTTGMIGSELSGGETQLQFTGFAGGQERCLAEGDKAL